MIGNIPAQNEWEINRLGKLTASKIRNILVKPRSKSEVISKTALTYLTEKVTELATGTSRQVSTYATEWGNEHEPVAAKWISDRYPDFEYLGKDSPKFFGYSDFSGGSPDGVSKASRLVAEIKCPENPANHTAHVMLKTQEDLAKAEPDYYCQIQFNMMCVAKKWGVSFEDTSGLFLSYCPLYEGVFQELQFKHIEIKPDLKLYGELKDAIPKAEELLATMYSAVLELTKPNALIAKGDDINGQDIVVIDKECA